MRHDAHYVDELESRRRSSDVTAPALAFPTSVPVTFALHDMSQELEGVASCFNLVSTKGRPLRERMGLSLARVGVERNLRAFQALRVLLEDPPIEPRLMSLNAIVEHTVHGFSEELRLTGSSVSLDPSESPIRLNADARMLSLALQACVGTLVSLVEASNVEGGIHITTRTSDGLASVRDAAGCVSPVGRSVFEAGRSGVVGPSGRHSRRHGARRGGTYRTSPRRDTRRPTHRSRRLRAHPYSKGVSGDVRDRAALDRGRSSADVVDVRAEDGKPRLQDAPQVVARRVDSGRCNQHRPTPSQATRQPVFSLEIHT